LEGRIRVWAESGPDTKTLYQLIRQDKKIKSEIVPSIQREEERKRITAVLKQGFANQKPRVLEQLKTMKAYLSLAHMADTAAGLQPVVKFKGRAELLKQKLEIWPADREEEWADEIGSHLFLGESACTPHS
jgi:hypothetical protein